MKCIHCGKWLGTNDDAEKHAGECPVMTGDSKTVAPANIQQQVQLDSASEPVVPIPVTGKMAFRFGTPTPRMLT